MRRLSRVIALLLAVAVAPAALLAQEAATVTGRVTGAQGEPEAGVSVRIESLAIGATTGPDGAYRLVIPAARVGTGQTVQISATRQGLATVTRTLTLQPGATLTQNFTMAAQSLILEGVVVTALGIERQEEALGVATETVQGEDISTVEPNLVAALSGQVAGVHITQGSGPGSSSRIVIRGANSISGNNQPLFIVDGVPIDNSSSRTFSEDLNWGNAAADIDPSNIASVTVLKGPNAAALYGSRAANGAVIITTKSGVGAGEGQVVVSQYASWEDELMLPDFQDRFGQGINGSFEYVDGNGGGTFDDVDESWGPPLDAGLLIPQFNSPMVNGVRVPTPWVSNPDNVDYFFQGGRTLTTNASMSRSGQNYNFRLSASRLDQEGTVPGFEMGRTTLGINGGMDVTNRLRATTSVQYTDMTTDGRPGIGYAGTNPLTQMIWFGRQVDIRDLAANYDSIREDGPNAGTPYNWNNSFHTNPYFLQLRNGNTQNRDRLIGNVQLSYELNNWLNVTGMTGMDWYQEGRSRTFAPGMVGVDLVESSTGGFESDQIGFQENNHQLLVTANPTLNGPFSFNVNVGAARRDYRRETSGTAVTQLIAPEVYSVENAAVAPIATDYISRKRVNSLLGQAEIGFNDYAFLTVTARNDWSSTLPEENRSYFYPSVSGSVILTDALDLSSSLLSYGKLRASWARVGNDADPYQLRNTFVASDIFDGFPTFAEPNVIANAQLRPETTESVEFGAELGFFDDRVGLDVTFYDETTSDQILPVNISRASGYTSRYLNAGSIRNNGVEVLLEATPIQNSNGFRWTTSFSFAKNNSEVVSLHPDVKGLQLGGEWYGQIWAREGEPYGQIVGYSYKRDSQGRIVVGASGNPVLNTTMKPVGNYNPDWTGGWTNDLGYKGLNLSFLLDIRQGGDIYSVTDMWGTYAGVLESTVQGRCWLPNEGYTAEAKQHMPPCLDANGNNLNGIVVDGVMVNAQGDTVPNTRVTSAQSYWNSQGVYANTEAHTFDASNIKLRQLTITYDVPGSLVNRLSISGLQLGLIGRNLAMWGHDKRLSVDPETAYDASNAQGFEFGTTPTSRSVGFSVTVRP